MENWMGSWTEWQPLTMAVLTHMIVQGHLIVQRAALMGQKSRAKWSETCFHIGDNGPFVTKAKMLQSVEPPRCLVQIMWQGTAPPPHNWPTSSRPLPSSQPERVRHPLPNRPMMLGEAPVMVTQLVCNRSPVPAPLCRDHRSPTGSGHQLTFPPGTPGNTPSQSRPCPHCTNLYLKLCSPQLPPTRTSTGPFTSL